MSIRLTYEDVVTRNIVLFLLISIIIFCISNVAPTIPGFPQPKTWQILLFFSINYLLVFCHNYFNVRLYLFKKKYWQFAFLAIIIVFVFIVFTNYFSSHYFIPTNVISEFIRSVILLCLGMVMYISHLWISANIIDTKKKLVNKESELLFLKQQLSPHFLLNSLNNLYGVSLAAPDMVSDKILELSDLLRYQIEATTKDSEMVETEIKFVDDYLNYAKYKAHNLHINITKNGVLDGYKIPTLLFLPLIENATKFCAETDHPAINVTWIFAEQCLTFTINNNCLFIGSKIKGTKIGIANLKRRLEIYPFKCMFTEQTTIPNYYKAELKLWIDN